MKNKKSQVTVFILIAILIVILILIYFSIRPDILGPRISPEARPVYNFVDSCIDKTIQDAIFNIGDSGGYYIVPNRSTTNNVAYYMYEGANYMPSKQRIEREISEYIDEMLFFCVENFVNFPDYKIEQGYVTTETEIKEDFVSIKINYPLSISKDNNTYNFKSFEKEVDVRLGLIYDIVYQIMQEQMKTPKDICISCIEGLVYEDDDLFVSMDPYDENAVVFSIIDSLSEVHSEAYRFYFANKYKTDETEKEVLFEIIEE